MVCLICGKSISADRLRNSKCNKEFSSLQTYFLTAWKNECATSTCEVLFDNKSDYFVDYFQNADYCSCCEQVVRDMNFTWKQIQSFEHQMLQLSKKIWNLISSNYQNIPKKSKTQVVEKRISSFLLQKDEPSLNIYSCHDMLEMMYSVISSQGGLQTHYTSNQSFVTPNIPVPSSSEMTCTPEETSESYDGVISLKCEVKYDPADSNEISHVNWPDISSSEDPLLTRSIQKYTNDDFNKDENFDDSDNCFIDDNSNEDDPISVDEVLQPNTQDEINNPSSHLLNEEYSGLVNVGESNCNSSETPPTPVHCTVEGCNLYFSTVKKMHRHVLMIHKVEKPYSCTQCPKRYTHNHNLRNHILKVHEKKKLYHFCSFCERLYENKDDLTLHYSNSHQEPNPFKCAFCPENLENRETLVTHTKNYHSQLYKDERRMVRCSECQKQCANKRSLRRHVMTLHGKDKMRKNKYPCQFCGKNYATEEERTFHYSIAHQDPHPNKCAFCPALYTNRNDLKKHTRFAHTDKVLKYKCDICNSNFTSIQGFNTHVVRFHEDGKDFPFKCFICNLTFTIPSMLKHHMQKHYNECKLKCEDCGNIFKTSQALMTHKSAVHGKLHVCKFCGWSFEGTLSTFLEHELTHHTPTKQKEIVHECKFCGRSYKSDEELNLHYSQSHQGPNPFTCAFCPDIFSNSVDLRKHTTCVHPDPDAVIKKFKCGKCNNVFKSKASLYSHVQVRHKSKSRRFKCHVCDRYFVDENRRNAHLAGHSKDEATGFICETCGKSFKTQRCLKSHTRHHDESERNVKCKICDKAFFTLAACKKHEITHTDIKQYVCDVCGRGFNNTGNLRAHIKIHTGDPSRFRKRKSKQPLNEQTV